MAPFKSNDIEAPLISEKAAVDASVENAQSNRHSRFVLTMQIFLHVVSFTAVIWLLVQVYRLQHELALINMGRLQHSDSQFHEPRLQSDQRSNDTATSGTADNKNRIRRQTGADTLDSASFSYPDYSMSNDFHSSFHVTGNQQSTVDAGSWFTFHTSLESDFARLSHEGFRFVDNKFFEVAMPGHYFVYSQIYYAGDGRRAIGHEIVVVPNCGEGSQFTILRAKTSQVVSESEAVGQDTGYTGGVFYLAANDRLGVRPLSYQAISSVYHEDSAQSSFFGAFLLAPDTSIEVDPDLRRCP